jgi:hypothetical protein
VRGRSTAEGVLAVVDEQPRDARKVYHRVASDADRREAHVTVKVTRVVLSRLADLGQVVRERRDDDGDGAVVYRCVGSWRTSRRPGDWPGTCPCAGRDEFGRCEATTARGVWSADPA